MLDTDLYKLFLDTPLDWDKKSYRFSRDEKDMSPYTLIDDDKSITIVHNVLGIDKKDLKLTIKEENGKTILLVEGITEDSFIKDKKYSISSTFALDDSRLDIAKASCTMKNGLLYIVIPTKEVETKTINIKVM